MFLRAYRDLHSFLDLGNGFFSSFLHRFVKLLLFLSLIRLQSEEKECKQKMSDQFRGIEGLRIVIFFVFLSLTYYSLCHEFSLIRRRRPILKVDAERLLETGDVVVIAVRRHDVQLFDLLHRRKRNDVGRLRRLNDDVVMLQCELVRLVDRQHRPFRRWR